METLEELRSLGTRDLRPQLPVFAGASFARNLGIARRLAELAARLGMTVTQLVLAWTLAQPGITAALTGPPNLVRDNRLLLIVGTSGKIVWAGR